MPKAARPAPQPKLSMEQVKAKLTKAPGPRVTEETMKAQIESVSYLVPENAPHTTICTLVMKNGFVFIGTSTPAAPENFNAAIGQRYAYENALRQIWTHEGYLLKYILGIRTGYGLTEDNIDVLLGARFSVPVRKKPARSKGVR